MTDGEPPRGETTDTVLEALERLQEVIEANSARNRAVIDRMLRVRQLRAEGLSYSEIVTAEEKPLIVEMATDNIAALLQAGAAFRRAEALALHEEGLTMDRIAGLFGVTRQRVSALLREARDARDPASPAAA